MAAVDDEKKQSLDRRLTIDRSIALSLCRIFCIHPYRAVMNLHSLSPGDFPEPKNFRNKLAEENFSKFPTLNKKQLANLETLLSQDIPRLMESLPKQLYDRTKELPEQQGQWVDPSRGGRGRNDGNSGLANRFNDDYVRPQPGQNSRYHGGGGGGGGGGAGGGYGSGGMYQPSNNNPPPPQQPAANNPFAKKPPAAANNPFAKKEPVDWPVADCPNKASYDEAFAS